MNRPHRPQANDITKGDNDLRPLNVKPLVQTDRMHNPKDIDVDEAAIAAGVQHGGMTETRAESLAVRGAGGRKRAQNTPHGRERPGRDISKKR